MMRESVIYQEILQEGRQEGIQQGIQQGVQQGVQQGMQQGKQVEARSLVLRQLTRKLGALDAELGDRIASLEIDRLEELAEALLGFENATDLDSWLSQNGISTGG